MWLQQLGVRHNQYQLVIKTEIILFETILNPHTGVLSLLTAWLIVLLLTTRLMGVWLMEGVSSQLVEKEVLVCYLITT